MVEAGGGSAFLPLDPCCRCSTQSAARLKRAGSDSRRAAAWMALTVNLLRRGGSGVAGSMLLPAQQPMAGAELRQRIAEQLGLAADLAEQLRLVHQGKEVGHGDMVAPVPNDEVVAAILPRGCDLRQATAINSPPTDGSPGKPEQPTGRMKRRRRADGERSNAPGNCKAISASDGVAVARVATFRTVPSAVQHDFAWRVMRVVEAIPPGKVAAYGQVARYAGAPRNARQVGKLLGTVLSGGIVPWQRVINASGRISLPADSGGDRQRRLLNAEGVRFKESTEAVVPEAFWAPDNSTVGSLFCARD